VYIGRTFRRKTDVSWYIDRIIEVTGRPSKDDIEAIQSEFAAQMLENLPEPNERGLESMYPNADGDAHDLLKKLLMFNPDKRITVEEALDHPYVTQFHNIEEEISCDKQIRIPIDDNKKFSVANYREELYTSVIKVNVETKKASRQRKGKSSGKRAKRNSKKSSSNKSSSSSVKKSSSTSVKKSSSNKKSSSSSTKKPKKENE